MSTTCSHENLRTIFDKTYGEHLGCKECGKDVWSMSSIAGKPKTVKSNAKVKKRIESLENKIYELDLQIENIQNTLCEHNIITRKNDGNTGNYSSSDDSYWTNYECQDCRKRWTIHY